MWLIVMFDLSTKSKKDKKEYSTFKSLLRRLGFKMMQYSVYYRECYEVERANSYRNTIGKNLPDNGFINMLQVNDVQMDNMISIRNNKVQQTPKIPKQLCFF